MLSIDFTGDGMNSRKHRCQLIFLTIVSLTVYSFSLGHDFILIWDDAVYVVANAAVQGVTLDHLKTAFTSIYAGNYAPVQITSYMLDYSLWGMKPSGFILTNIILHTINGLLMYFLLVRSRLDRTTACAAAFIFLLHPVQVESVVWISQRKSQLAMAFFLLSFHWYLNYRDVENSKKAALQYLLSLAGFVIALLSKSVVVILPVVLVIHDRVFAAKGRPSPRFVDKIPYVVIAVIGALGALYSQQPQQVGGRTEFHGGSALATFLTMLPVLLKYIRLIFWPSDLSLVYDIPVRTGLDEEVVLAGTAAAILTVLGIYLFKRRRELFCWYALFFVGLLPVSQIVPILTLINDRYLYFPMLGGAPFVCAAVALLIQSQSRWQKPMLACCGVLLLSLPVLTYKRTQVWQNSFTIWQDVVLKNPAHKPGWFYLADEYILREDVEGALATSLASLEYFPREPAALKLVGIIYGRKGELLKAREYLQQAAKASPDDIEVLYLLADNYLRTGNKQEAVSIYLAVLALIPDSERALQGLRDAKRQE